MVATEVLPSSSHQRAGLPFALAGSLCVVAGGLLAAAVATSPSEHAVWAAAYLVLVAGVAQIAVGAAQTYLHARPLSQPVVVGGGQTSTGGYRRGSPCSLRASPHGHGSTKNSSVNTRPGTPP